MKDYVETVDNQDFFATFTEPCPLTLAQRKITTIEKETRAVIAQPKLDGIRVRYEPRWGKLITRNNMEIECVDHILQAIKDQGLEKQEFDGELYCHGECFDDINRLVRGKTTEKEHLQLEFHIFDKMTYATMIERTRILRSLNLKAPLFFVDTRMILTQKGIKKYYDLCLKRGYEGIMLRWPNAYYAWGRTQNLRRMKPDYDTEAILVGFNKTSTRYASTFGSLILELPNGIQFNCAGLTDAQRQRIHADQPLGAVVTFEHSGFTKHGKPRFPRFKGLRVDIDATALKDKKPDIDTKGKSATPTLYQYPVQKMAQVQRVDNACHRSAYPRRNLLVYKQPP